MKKGRKVLRSKKEELNNNCLYQETHYTRTQHDACFFKFVAMVAT
jgi:hypothetical protein